MSSEPWHKRQHLRVSCRTDGCGYRKYPERPAGADGRPAASSRRSATPPVSIIAALHVATGQVIAEPITSHNSPSPASCTAWPSTLIGACRFTWSWTTGPAIPPGHLGRDRRAAAAQRHLHAEARLLAGHGRTLVLRLTRAVLRRGEFTSRADLIEKITAFTTRQSRTARPWKSAYDARADYSRYCSRHSGQHTALATEPTAGQTLQQAA